MWDVCHVVHDDASDSVKLEHWRVVRQVGEEDVVSVLQRQSDNPTQGDTLSSFIVMRAPLSRPSP